MIWLKLNAKFILAAILVSVVCGCNTKGWTRTRTVTLSWGTTGNLAVDVYHGGGDPHAVEMQFFLDGEAIGKPQRVSRGRPAIRNLLYTFRIDVPPGEHVLRAEIPEQRLAAESKFVVKDAETEVYGLITYENLEKKEPRLQIEFGSHPLIGFA